MSNDHDEDEDDKFDDDVVMTCHHGFEYRIPYYMVDVFKSHQYQISKTRALDNADLKIHLESAFDAIFEDYMI